jgi:hypothetical protein
MEGSCVLDRSRPCSSKSRAKNRYTKEELETLTKKCNVVLPKAATIDTICAKILEKITGTGVAAAPKEGPATPEIVAKAKKEAPPKPKNTKKTVKEPIPIKKVDPPKKETKIKDTTKVLKVKDINNIVEPPKPYHVVNLTPEIKEHNPQEIMFQRFKEYFHDDLLGFLNIATPKFRVITAGGYGLKALLETKHNMFGKVNTGDVDFTVSTWKSSMNPLQCYNYWYNKLFTFFSKQETPSDFQVKVLNFGHSYVPIMNYYRNYVIMISYKGEEFVDVAITNLPITTEMVDKITSLKAGIPVKTEKYYLKEFLTLIYMENVPGVSAFCYAKRNPVTGKLTCKGSKDIERSKVLCEIGKAKLYKRYCELILNVSVDKLKGMTKQERDAYFVELKDLVREK